MHVANVQVQVLLRGACVAAVFAHIKFVSSLFVGVLLLHTVDLLQVGLQGAALGEGFVANLTLVRTNPSMGPDMSFQIKGVVEAFSTEGAQVPLHLAVTLDVTVEHPLQAKAFATQLAVVHSSIVTGAGGELDFRPDHGALDGQVQQHPPGRAQVAGDGLWRRGIAGLRVPGAAAPAALQAAAVLVAQQHAADPACSGGMR